VELWSWDEGTRGRGGMSFGTTVLSTVCRISMQPNGSAGERPKKKKLTLLPSINVALRILATVLLKRFVGLIGRS
jgi:hypothetical protein